MPWWRRADPEPRRKPSDVEDMLDRAFADLNLVTIEAHRVAKILAEQVEREGAGGERKQR